MRKIFIIVLTVLSIAACSAKRNGFLGAEDLRYATLPGEGSSPQYALKPKDPAEDQLTFVNLPLPLPSFIGKPPQAYIETLQQNKHRFAQSVSLGHNTNNKPSLLIQPAFGEDRNDVLTALRGSGFNGEGNLLTTDAATGTPMTAQIQAGDDLLVVHLDDIRPTDNTKKKRRKKDAPTEEDTVKFNAAGFKLLDRVRRDYIGLGPESESGR